MIEITDELIKKLDKIYSTGERNRNNILNILIANDKKLKKIYELYKMKKNDFEIMVETKLPIEFVRESIENIDKLNRIIDHGITSIAIDKCNKKKNEKKKFVERLTPKAKNEKAKTEKISRKKDDEGLEL